MRLVISILSLIILLQCGFPGLVRAERNYRIIAIQHQEFGSYTESYNGFAAGLRQLGLADKVELERFNANSDMSALEARIEALSGSREFDLILGLGTQSTVRLIERIKHIPIVFTDLGDPEHSGVVTDWKSSGANYTGVETPEYVTLGIRLIHELISFKRLGMIYLSDAVEHAGAVSQARNLCASLGVTLVAEGFPLRDKNLVKYPRHVIQKHIAEALGRVAPQVDVFYVQISKTFEDDFRYFRDAFQQYKIPSVGDPVYIKRGIIMGIGRDKHRFGEQCAEYAVKILRGAKPADLPMDVGRKFSISFNLKAAAMVDFNPPVDVLGAADIIYEEIEP